MTETYGAMDRYAQRDWGDLESGQRQAGSMEGRSRAPDQSRVRAELLRLLGVSPGIRLLDVGCGTGPLLRDAAPLVRPGGRTVGLDPVAGMIELAREKAREAGLEGEIELYQGEAEDLPFGDGEFDLAVAFTVLCHLVDARAGIAEMARVTQPGGRLAALDHDLETFVIQHPDRDLTRRVLAPWVDQQYADGWIGRKLPHLLAEAGLEQIEVRGFVEIQQDPDGFLRLTAERAAKVAEETGAISPPERSRWRAALAAEAAAGRFFASRSYFLAWGRKP
ncbi:MAG: methyltransferase domain-containing protein [Chloroflexi bacterium]|nr:methyltransferase domain-containing protein [Chloroflexota bacterium]